MRIMPEILAAFLALTQDGAAEEQFIEVPIRGLTARCCEAPVVDALETIPAVERASLRRVADVHLARLVLREGETVRLSEVDQALEQANRKMGDAMGTRYAVDGSLNLEFAYLFIVKDAPGELERRLEELPSFRSVSRVPDGFRPVFRGERLPKLAEVMEVIAFSDVVLAPVGQGVRYVCPDHPARVFATAGSCSECNSRLERFEASLRTVETPVERPQPKKSGC